MLKPAPDYKHNETGNDNKANTESAIIGSRVIGETLVSTAGGGGCNKAAGSEGKMVAKGPISLEWLIVAGGSIRVEKSYADVEGIVTDISNVEGEDAMEVG